MQTQVTHTFHKTYMEHYKKITPISWGYLIRMKTYNWKGPNMGYGEN